MVLVFRVLVTVWLGVVGLVLVVLLWGVVCWVGCCLGFRWRGL